MNTFQRILSAGLVTGLVAAAALAVAQDGRRAQRVNAGPAGPTHEQPAGKTAPAPEAAGAGGANLIAGVAPNPHGIAPGSISGPGVFTSNGFLMSASPFNVQQALPNFFPTPLAGLSKQPGSLFFTFTGAFGEGGNVYHYPPGGPFILAGPGGFGVGLAGLAYDSTGALWASGDAFIVNDALYTIDVATGLATGVGGFGANICGVDGIAEDPTTNTLYGFTGFCYDGSPGDVLIIDKGTGAATDTGIDLTDAAGNLPVCSVVGATFAADGTGYASIGCHHAKIITFKPVGPVPFQFSLLGDAYLTDYLPGGSLTDIEVVF